MTVTDGTGDIAQTAILRT